MILGCLKKKLDDYSLEVQYPLVTVQYHLDDHSLGINCCLLI